MFLFKAGLPKKKKLRQYVRFLQIVTQIVHMNIDISSGTNLEIVEPVEFSVSNLVKQ